MMTQPNVYDELPYKSFSIEWTAPERLALASLIHGGPRQSLDSYRVLELGCGDGSNLLPMAYYRRQGNFLGIDGAGSQIDIANSRKKSLGLTNIEFIHTDFRTAAEQIEGKFDFIIAHGVFSWVPHDVRDALLRLCAEHLRPGGLLYLNYNTKPGWNVRGMVRDFLIAQTQDTSDLTMRAQLAQEVSAKIASSMIEDEAPYSQLLANEFRFVCENHHSYIAHEYLAEHNQSYWRSEFMTLARDYGLDYVADADFSYDSGRIDESLAPGLNNEDIIGSSLDNTVDFLCYRQLHSPILTQSPVTRHAPKDTEFSQLSVASCMAPCASSRTKHPMFQHPSGFEVEAKTEAMRLALTRLQPLWPRGLAVASLFSNVSEVMDDLKLLHRNGLIELRCIEPEEFSENDRDLLNSLEGVWDGYKVTPYHTREAA